MTTQEVIMLCPVCQHTRKATIGIKIHDEEDSYSESPKKAIGVALWAKCKNCGTDMYTADNELIDALKMLNDAGIHTTSHCSAAHPNGGYETDCKRCAPYLYDQARYERGPYIMMTDLTCEQIQDLIEYARGYEIATDTFIIEVEHKGEFKHTLHGCPSDREYVTIAVMCADIDAKTVTDACFILTTFVKNWLESTNAGVLPTGKGSTLRRIANKAYFYPNSHRVKPDEN